MTGRNYWWLVFLIIASSLTAGELSPAWQKTITQTEQATNMAMAMVPIAFVVMAFGIILRVLMLVVGVDGGSSSGSRSSARTYRISRPVTRSTNSVIPPATNPRGTNSRSLPPQRSELLELDVAALAPTQPAIPINQAQRIQPEQTPEKPSKSRWESLE